jgi:ferredoxin
MLVFWRSSAFFNPFHCIVGYVELMACRWCVGKAHTTSKIVAGTTQYTLLQALNLAVACTGRRCPACWPVCPQNMLKSSPSSGLPSTPDYRT